MAILNAKDVSEKSVDENTPQFLPFRGKSMKNIWK